MGEPLAVLCWVFSVRSAAADCSLPRGWAHAQHTRVRPVLQCRPVQICRCKLQAVYGLHAVFCSLRGEMPAFRAPCLVLLLHTSNPGNGCAQHPLLALFILQAIAAGYVALLAISILLFRVNVLWIVLYAILGFPIGLGYSWLLNTARRTRQQTAAQVGHLPAILLLDITHSLREVLWSAGASGTGQPSSIGGHPRTGLPPVQCFSVLESSIRQGHLQPWTASFRPCLCC